MRAKGHARVVAIEQRRKYLFRQHSRHEQIVARQRLDHHCTEFACFRGVLGQTVRNASSMVLKRRS